MADPFWTRWQRVLVESSLQVQYEQIVATERLENFRRVARGESGTHKGYYYNDSDVYKWLEACAYALSGTGSEDLRRMMYEVVDAIAAAQAPDGYLNTFFQLNHPHLKWRNLGAMHEMYCAGHLIEAGVATFECLADRRLLDVSTRLADHIMSVFGPDKRRGYCGHQELELALIRLAEATGEAKYRNFARWQIEQRGTKPSIFEQELEDPDAMRLSPWAPSMLRVDGEYRGDYAQDHAPVRDHTEVVGHAVRAMYFYAAAAELAKEDPTLTPALETVWQNLTTKRMYVTGGIGPSAKNEGFTADYDLPNLTAYAETCAAIGLIMWGRRMLELTGDSEYADLMERALYNGAISGISLSGDRFFYTNPLESRGEHERVPWFSCACCPPNIARLIGSVGQYVASASDDAFYVHMPAGFEAHADFAGTKTKISVQSNYPWAGTVTIRIDPDEAVSFALHVRIPDWAEDLTAEGPGEAVYENGYAVYRRTWSAGDTITLELPMQPRWVAADPRVLDDIGLLALTRGPLVYCCEDIAGHHPPQRFTVDTSVEAAEQWQDALLEGVMTLSVEGSEVVSGLGDRLYGDPDDLSQRPATHSLIPYYAWANRGPSHMQVWLRQ
jgi:uncharacterized protein